MKPSDQWPLYIKDSQKFSIVPLKDEVSVWVIVICFLSVITIIGVHLIAPFI